jgi:Fe2+ or Zn2+ uptake regulation protein
MLAAMNPELHDTAALRLRRLGQRYTGNRRTIVDTLASSRHPMTTSDIRGSRRGLALSSVYRNLAVLEQAGIVHRVLSSDEFARYELAEDLTEHHHHMICSRCGSVTDFTPPGTFEKQATKALGRVASRSGFSLQSHRFDLIGLCSRCA